MTAVIGTTYLKVADLDNLVRFYQDIIGLRVQHQEKDTVYLGADGKNHLLALTPKPDGKRYRGTTGLYHFAILTPSRFHLATSLMRLIETRTPLQGASDHLVSEALYLADPEGNGIEIYADRSRDTWFQFGEMRMGTLPMDVEGVLSALEGHGYTWNGMDEGTIMGHMHLHVASIPPAEAFYQDVLGMDIMFSLGTAIFASYDGYHHHLGANTWSGREVPPPDALGLDKFVLRVPEHVLEGLPSADIPVEESEEGILVRDPSQNVIALAAAPTPA